MNEKSSPTLIRLKSGSVTIGPGTYEDRSEDLAFHGN